MSLPKEALWLVFPNCLVNAIFIPLTSSYGFIIKLDGICGYSDNRTPNFLAISSAASFEYVHISISCGAELGLRYKSLP